MYFVFINFRDVVGNMIFDEIFLLREVINLRFIFVLD